jgi:hypothetical protein
MWKPNREDAMRHFPLHSTEAITYSEEAIPERNPEYRMGSGTLNDEQTVDEISPEMRIALVRRLVQLGMCASRAALVASL